MKTNPAAHKIIFIIVCACFAVMAIAAAVAASRDEGEHRAHYAEYQVANYDFAERRFEESYAEFQKLAAVYDDAYILELKMTVCAMNMEMWAEAVGHARRTLELYPMLAKDEDFMYGISYCLKQLGETEASEYIEDYYYSFAAKQK